MIRNAILHLLNEQPLLVDLAALPAAGDTCLVCSNVRTTGGARPVWVSDAAGQLLFPIAQVRFLELPAVGSVELPVVPESTRETPLAEPELPLDEDLLRRIRES
ncbi:MAG: hypothetical protein ACP5VP_07775 [Candidatus Limnocylindrales bacterium]